MDLTNIVGLSGLPAFVYYTAIVIAAVFFAGWHLKSKLKAICEENNKELEDRMTALEARLYKHEDNSVDKVIYTQDMLNVCKLIAEVKTDIKDGINTVTARIDNLILKKVAE